MSARLEQGLELKKHVNLIHCSNDFSFVQRKLFNALLFNAYPDLANQNHFVISARELCTMIGYKSNDYKGLKNSLLGLITTAVEWNVIEEHSLKNSNEKWSVSSAISSVTLEKGVCTYEYSSVMKEFFYQPEIYGRINVSLLPKFKSLYGLALYENCVRYQGVPQTPWFRIEIFRKLMGVDPEQYDIFTDFKRRVLNVAVNEVNLYSSIKITPEVKRVNKKVVSIRFLIAARSSDSSKFIEKNRDREEADIENLLSNKFQLSSKIISNILEKYGTQYTREKINMVLSSPSFRSGKVLNAAAYLMQALKENFQQNKIASKKEILESAKKPDEVLQAHYKKYIATMIAEFTAALSSCEFDMLVNKFEDSLKAAPGIIYNWFKKEKLEHPAVKAMLSNYIIEHHLTRSNNFLNFEEFSKQYKVG